MIHYSRQLSSYNIYLKIEENIAQKCESKKYIEIDD